MRRIYKPRPSTTMSIPAPIGGWNARDSLASMDPKDAVILQNFWPTTTDIMIRNGYSRFAYGFLSQVETLMWYSSGTANKLFAIEGPRAWNATAGGDFSAGTPDLTGLTNARWQYFNITTAGGSFLLMVNGSDKLRGYTGSAWYADGDGSHDITGVDTSTATNINLHKARVWFCIKQSLKAWYLGTNAISGAATAFDLSSVAREGGYLIAMATWTIDGGYGLDDLAVFITSNGEFIVYRGTDPASASTWALIGIFALGSPIGARCFLKYAGDLLVLTQDGLVPMAQGLQSSRLDPRVNITNKIQQAISDSTTMYSKNFGWQIVYYAKASMLILNVPVNTGSSQQQYCMNTISGAWCNFIDVNANCWELFNDEPYFGANGYIGKFWSGNTDYPTATSININSKALQAFNYCSSPGEQKQFTLMRPILNTNGQPSIYSNINVDYDLSDTTAALSFSATTFSTWDTSLWDTGVWGGNLNIQKTWQGATGVGFCMAPQLKCATQGIETHWMATDVVFARGGTL